MNTTWECVTCGHSIGVHDPERGCCGTDTGTINGTPCKCTRAAR